MTSPRDDHVRCVAITLAKPGHEDALRSALAGLLLPTRAEPGCIRYELHRDLDEPRRFIILEEWRDRVSFDAHCVAPRIRRYAEEARDLIEFAVFHPVAPI